MDSTNWGDGIASSRTFGGCHSIHLSYGRTNLILQEIPHDRESFGRYGWGREWVRLIFVISGWLITWA
jgi:hypothetical protein